MSQQGQPHVPSISEIDCGASLRRLLVQRSTGANKVRDIGNVHANLWPTRGKNRRGVCEKEGEVQ